MTKSLIKETPPRWKSVLDKARGDFMLAERLQVVERLQVATAAVLPLRAYADGSDEGPWDATAGDGATAEDLLEIAEESLFMQPLARMAELTATADAAVQRMRVWHGAFCTTPVDEALAKELNTIVDKCSARMAERRALTAWRNLQNSPRLLRRSMTAARDRMEGNEEFSGHLLKLINDKFPPEAPPEHKEHAKRAEASPRASMPRSGTKRKA